ncbi:2-hydroxyacyl-CoA dehydratase family protein [Candidatus Bipolaricaulota bacterium]|nr:2-hydroxyacyl-CoA dehydratase family protein [Candidatus Bipolaricaulota bacterium]
MKPLAMVGKERLVVQAHSRQAVLQVFKDAAACLRNPDIEEWERRGGQVVGYLYSFVPEEIIAAGGLLPFRLRATGSTGTEFSDSRLTQINCSFVRHCLDSALRGRLEFLDGLIAFKQCDQIFRLYEHWIALVDTPFHHYLTVPKKSGEPQMELYRRELSILRTRLEDHFDTEISDTKLRHAIRLHNETRRLQRKLYELKKRERPPLTGAETLAVMVAGTAMSKERYNALLRNLLEEIADHEPDHAPSARLLLIGRDQDNPGFVEIVESQGGMIVTDTLSFGTSSSWFDVAEDGDPLDALADYYLNKRPACPRIAGRGSERYEYIEQLISDYGVDGVLLVRHPFCDMWGFEQGSVTRHLKSKRVPHMVLETEYVPGGAGQLETRVQAFLETLWEASAR